MNKNLLLLSVFCLSSLVVNAQFFNQGKKDYKQIVGSWNVASYNQFLNSFPKSKYKFDIQQRLLCKQRNDAFREIITCTDTLRITAHLAMYDTCTFCTSYLPNESLKWLGYANRDLQGIRARLDSLRCQYFWDDYIINSSGDEYEIFENFLVRFPSNHLQQRAIDSVQTRKDRLLWKKTITQNNAQGYKEYLEIMPNGLHADEASILYKDHELGESLLKLETHAQLVDGMRKLKATKRYSPYTQSILNKIKMLEEKDYRLCENKSNLNEWLEFERQFSGGYFFADVDMKIRSISKLKSDEARSQYGTFVEMGNLKPHPITFEYSSSNSKSLVFEVKVGTTVTSILPNGLYKLKIKNSLTGAEIISEPIKLIGRPQPFSCCQTVLQPKP
jgi:hypothetical protein